MSEFNTKSEGPFSAGRCDVWAEHPEPHDGAAVFGANGQPYVLIADDLVIGGDALPRAEALAAWLNETGWGGDGQSVGPGQFDQARADVAAMAREILRIVTPDRGAGNDPVVGLSRALAAAAPDSAVETDGDADA